MKVALIVLALGTQISCADYVPKRQEMAAAPTENVPMSIAEVIATALPSTLVSAIVANPVSFAEALSSQFAAGHTPAWYSNLPDSVKSQVIPPGLAVTPASTTVFAVSTKGPPPIFTRTPGATETPGPIQTGTITSIDFSTLPHVVLTLPGPRPATSLNTTTTTQNPATTTITQTSSRGAMTSSDYSPPAGRSSDSFSSSASSSGQASPTSTGGVAARPSAVLGVGLVGLMGVLGFTVL